MLVKMRVFDENQQVTIHYQTEINASALIDIGRPRLAVAREKGKTFTEGAVAFFGEEFIKAVQADNKHDIEKAALEAALAAWLSDHVFSGVTEAQFVRCDLEFNMHPTGMVVYNRKTVQ